MASTFAAQVGDWINRVDGALLAVFRESAQVLVSQLDQQLTDMVYDQPQSASGYNRTGFLRASLMASREAMPTLSRENPGNAASPDLWPVILVINSAEVGDTLYLGYTANYAAYVHYGVKGNQPRQWMTLVAERWQEIVTAKAKEVKARLGL